MPSIRILLAGAGACLTLVAGAVMAPQQPARAELPDRSAGTVTSGPFATVMFSRTEMTAADGCVANDGSIARLDTVVAPFLASVGMAGTGTLVTGRTATTVDTCTHANSSLTASWAQATMLSQAYGWHFVSHTATYPANLKGLSPAQAQAETCGSATTIDAHGLPGGHGLIAYPGGQQLPLALQTTYAATCFAWGRRYNISGTTSAIKARTVPYWQLTASADGGACNEPTATCYTIASSTNRHYVLPDSLIATVATLGAGEWFTLQSFVLVTGANPAYVHSPYRWDCTSPDPRLHWSNDNERYCYADWEAVVTAIAAVPEITVTDPLTVGIAFGRPATYPVTTKMDGG